MSKNNIIINFFIIILIFSFSSNDDYINRHENNYSELFDCKEKNKNGKNITNSEDCFNIKAGRKWKCCYFEYKVGEETKYGCMRYRKNNETDLYDLEDYISTLSSGIMLDCGQNYLIYSIGILFVLLFFLL